VLGLLVCFLTNVKCNGPFTPKMKRLSLRLKEMQMYSRGRSSNWIAEEYDAGEER